MRGSVYYQSSQLVKQIFQEGAKKEDKINPNHEHYQMVSSYKTMESYRRVWNNFFNYLLEHWKIRNFEKISSEHVQAYMDYKIEYYPSKQYLEKISAAIGKLEIALKNFNEFKKELFTLLGDKKSTFENYKGMYEYLIDTDCIVDMIIKCVEFQKGNEKITDKLKQFIKILSPNIQEKVNFKPTIKFLKEDLLIDTMMINSYKDPINTVIAPCS